MKMKLSIQRKDNKVSISAMRNCRCYHKFQNMQIYIMTGLEERLSKESVDIPMVWMRFIDDVFFIWAHGKENLETFINFLNSCNETTKFTGSTPGRV